jgi:hypothetical protein
MRGFKVFVSGAALVAMTSSFAVPASAQEPAAAAAQEEKKVFPLPQTCQDCDVVLVTMIIKPDKTADFEMVLNKVKEALAKSDKPERKQQAAGWQVFKAAQAAPQGAVYIMRIDPVVKGAEYDLMKIISEVFPVEVQEIFAKYKEAFAGRGLSELKSFVKMQ